MGGPQYQWGWNCRSKHSPVLHFKFLWRNIVQSDKPLLHRKILPSRPTAMPTVIYSLDNAIDTFFSEAGASLSKTQCDDVIRQRYGERIQPVDIQGLSSYTVITGPSRNKIIQFREQADLLDMNLLALAKEVHGDLVPSCSELGWVGEPNGPRLAIYEMDRLPGENYVIIHSALTYDKRINTVNCLARFVKPLSLLFCSSYQSANIK
jgi:hypothetical protein